jgi:hypothetical protein
MAIPRLTALVGDPIEWKEENIEAIAAALVQIQDKQAAYKAVWEAPSGNAPQGPGTEGKDPKATDTGKTPEKPAEVEGAGNKDEADMPPTA